jgi:hypothetical protein
VLSPEVLEILAAEPGADGFGAMFPLLTVDSEGYPWPCYLSGRELVANAQAVYIGIRSRRARANLERFPQASLLVVGPRTAYTFGLTVTATTTTPGGVVLVAFACASVDEDTVGTDLMPMAFAATDELIRREGADDHTSLLLQFAAEYGHEPATTAKRRGAREVATQ